ncbi:MAG: substrate-binding domain-containing protein [Treponema sp.]|nr:substrate-binding domain-containing protein [Treponema sp.]
MAHKKKRIGLVLATIHTGISLDVWDSFIRTAANENISLFIFPGGRLNAHEDFEAFRNQVYYLVNKDNLDGCVSWSSTIRYNQSTEEFERFHAGFEPLPYVTLSFKSPGHPTVDFDAYNGMKSLISHCIHVHGAKKIAFIRGPEFHQSAQARYEGYNDALKESGLVDSSPAFPLVTDPFNWNAGNAAAAQLFEERSLVPGRDFDTLVCSSDLTALDAINYFARHGYHVPVNYRVVGFNNSVESRVAESPLSTVQLPNAEMAQVSVKMLLGMLGRKKSAPPADVLLNTRIILRESCGCSHSDSSEEIPVRMTRDDLISEQLAVRVRYEKERCGTVLNSLKCSLFGTRDRHSLVQNLAHYLPKIGIHTAAVVLYGDEKTSVFTGGFSNEGMSPIREQRFPARYLVPPGLQQQFANGIFLVQPLFIENQSLGYFIHNVPVNKSMDGVIHEELRSAVSYALKGIFLLEETVRIKKNAEQAERAKTELIQIMENSLFDLLQNIAEHIELMEKSTSLRELHKDIMVLKSLLTSKETDTGRLKNLSLTRLDELTLQKRLFDMEELLPKTGAFPLILGDTTRLALCFSLIREHYNHDYSIELTYGGLSITFKKGNIKAHSGKTDRAEKAQRFPLLLAERIILMHEGDFSLYRDCCTVTLPWTTLTGQKAKKNTISSHNHVLVLSDPALLPANFFTLPQIYDAAKAQPVKTAFIAWNAPGAGTEERVKVSGLKRRSTLAGIPFLCYGMPTGAGGTIDAAASIIEAVEYTLKSPKKGAVLFIGSSESWIGSTEHFLPSSEFSIDKIRIPSMEEFNETISEINPVLIMFSTLDTEGAAAVRRHPLTVMVPVIMIGDRIDNQAEVNALSQYSRLILCHRAIVTSEEFRARIRAIIGGDEILPLHTGTLIKKTILYFGQHAESHITRWKLADKVNVSEDYLTRMFRREMGLSLWDYLNRLRIFQAAEYLQKTNHSIQHIAVQTGFQDQAYFCRVFKKIYGIPPGQLRK